MSLAQMALAWKAQCGASAKLVLLALADHADDNGQCWPGLTGVRAKCGLSESTLHRAIAELAKAGLVMITPQKRADGTQSTNLYTLQIDRVGVSNRQGEGVILTPQGAASDTLTPPKMTPLLNPHLEPSLPSETEKSPTVGRDAASPPRTQATEKLPFDDLPRESLS